MLQSCCLAICDGKSFVTRLRKCFERKLHFVFCVSTANILQKLSAVDSTKATPTPLGHKLQMLVGWLSSLVFGAKATARQEMRQRQQQQQQQQQ
ncbi:uncharacterized protein Dmoj_GI26126, isoform B [Drosophila mojavensis]|uniref:Uncharacterized protein, isoform B n=1 Tax=Drosophila mojavensis TaxID=7230 RepID=A0A0Q9XG60_DROMO|nr:uncharacterized protein Dmoj_GI26126, isoform B [Drosophila mojavensis]